MKSIFLLVAASPVAALALAQTPGSVAAGSPEITVVAACPAGTVWDGQEKKCLPRRPRGSHSGIG